MLVVVLNMPEHSSFQDMLFPMLLISEYAKSYASIMDTGISLPAEREVYLHMYNGNVNRTLHAAQCAEPCVRNRS